MKYSDDPLRKHLMWRRYTYRFLPAWGGALLLCLNSIAGNMTHSLWYYAKVYHLPTEYAFGTAMTFCLVFYVGQIMLCEGSRHAPRILIPVVIVNLLLATAYLGSHRPTLFNLIPLFSALLYIWVLNSKNHRRYTSMLRVKRRQRIRANAHP